MKLVSNGSAVGVVAQADNGQHHQLLKVSEAHGAFSRSAIPTLSISGWHPPRFSASARNPLRASGHCANKPPYVE
jgi:hypothetical protein